MKNKIKIVINKINILKRKIILINKIVNLHFDNLNKILIISKTTNKKKNNTLIEKFLEM